jgi:hypothetical protein
MVTVCAWCDRYLGGPNDGGITHGICTRLHRAPALA